MALTKSQILSWDLSVLTATGAAWTALGSKIEDLFARYKHAVVAVNHGHWEGETADAAVGRAGSDERTAVQVMAHLARAAKIAADGFRLVNAPLGRARQAIADTEAAGYTVREDLSVYKDGKSTEADEKAMQKWANTIKAEADATEAADKQVKTSLNGARADLRIAFAAPTGGTPPTAPPRSPASSESIVGEAGALPDLPGNPAATPGAARDPAAGTLPWLLSHAQNGSATTAAPPPVSPKDVESFKVVARQMLASQGVPPDQIEAQVNAALIQAQQPTSRYVAPEQQRQSPGGFGDGLAARLEATTQGVQNLFGQGGPGAPGVLESWAGLAKGVAEQYTNPVGAAIAEVQHALNAPSPAYALGEKAFDIGAAAATLPFGGEGAAVRAGLGDIGPGVLETGPAASQHAVIGFENPATYHSWAEGAAMDLNHAYTHGGPTPGLSQQLADMATHYVGDTADRVVLGKFDGQDGGYIGGARGDGGIYFDTGDPTWDAMTSGLDRPAANALAWQVNEQFLRGQMDGGVGRIEYTLPPNFGSVEEVLKFDPTSFSAKEIAFLQSNAEAYGYQQVGDSWILGAGGGG